MPITAQQATARAQAVLRAFCGWHVSPSRTETVQVPLADLVVTRSGHPVLLPTMHVTALTAAALAGAPIDLATLDLSLEGMLHLHGPLPPMPTTPDAALALTITHGHPDWPGDLAALLDTLTARAQQPASNLVQVGQARIATAPDGAPWGIALTTADRTILERYRLPYRP